MPFWKDQAFKALQQQWYKRLEESGFEDAEEMVGGELCLKQTAASAYKALDDITRKSKEAYFVFVAQKVEETVFTSTVDRIILSGHASGKKICHIVKDLESNGVRRGRDTVRWKIRTYEMKWGLRTYTPRELHRRVS